MGSITGTPANGILVLYGTLHAIPGMEYMNFGLWLLWGIPLVGVLVITAWAVLSLSFGLWSYNNDLVHITFREEEAFHPLQRVAATVSIGCFVLFILFSNLMRSSSEKFLILALTGLFTFILIFLLFFLPIRPVGSKSPQTLLTIRDCYSNLPWRGLIFVGVIFLIIGVGALLDLQHYIIRLFGSTISQETPRSLLYLIIAALTSFSTEILSNTVVQLAMFTVVEPLFNAATFATIQTFLIITLSCTCAFMTPIATGVNGLAFGEMKGISLVRMLVAGFMMKLVGAAIIAFSVPYVLGSLVGSPIN
jgi:sodium-dependent dicarboxylate transporter 2/3/5